MVVIIACRQPFVPISDCEIVDLIEYEDAARLLGQNPEIPNYPDGAVYRVCYTDDQLTSVRMTDGDKPDKKNTIPAGTYSGELNFHKTLEDDADYTYLPPVCSENNAQLTIGSDGAAQGEIRSICNAKNDTDNEEMQTTHYNEVTGVIRGELLDMSGKLTISYTWHSYFT